MHRRFGHVEGAGEPRLPDTESRRESLGRLRLRGHPRLHPCRVLDGVPCGSRSLTYCVRETGGESGPSVRPQSGDRAVQCLAQLKTNALEMESPHGTFLEHFRLAVCAFRLHLETTATQIVTTLMLSR